MSHLIHLRRIQLDNPVKRFFVNNPGAKMNAVHIAATTVQLQLIAALLDI